MEFVDNLTGGDHDAVDFLVEVYHFKKADFNQFRDLLAAIPWNCCSGGSDDEDWLKFKKLLLSVADQCIPVVTLHPKKRMNWLSGETLHMIKCAFKLAKQSQKDKHFRKHRNISNRVHELA